MATKGERAAILEFLGDLRDNNDREWFEANRDRYEEVRATFLGLVGEILSAFDPVEDLGGIDVKACVFRINRDVRLFGEISGERLKTAPAGYAKGHHDIELLRLKQLLAVHGMSDAFVRSGDLVGRAIEAFGAMRPFLLWLEKAVG
jgi:uncharacterized protein (DUF2461 family)